MTKLSKKFKHYNIPIGLLNKGMLIGNEDSLMKVPYSKSVKCKSIKAEVYAIQANNFFDIIRQCKRSQKKIFMRENFRMDNQIEQIQMLKHYEEEVQKTKS